MISIDSPTVFLPGTLCDERIWMPCWRYMSLNQRHYVPLQWANSKAEMLALTSDRIERAGQPVHLVGYSMGGYIALLAALEHTKHQAVKSLTLVGYNPFGLSPEEKAQRQATLNALKRGNFTISSQYLKRFYTELEMTQSALTQPVIDMASDLGSATLKTQFLATSEREDLSTSIKKLGLPVHLICSEQDKIANADAITTLAGNKQVQVSQLTNTAHMMPLTQSDTLAKLISEFIQTTD